MGKIAIYCCYCGLQAHAWPLGCWSVRALSLVLSGLAFVYMPRDTLKMKSCRGLRSPPASSNCSKYAVTPSHLRGHSLLTYKERQIASINVIYSRRGWLVKIDCCGTPFFIRHNLLCLPLPLARIKLLFWTSIMIIRIR